MVMRFLFHSVILFLCAQPVLAQYSLKQTQPIADHYIVQFHEVENSAQQLRRNKRDGLKALRLQQQIFIERFNEDLRHTDLKILRNLWLKQALAIQISKQYLADIYSLSYVTELKPDQRYQVDTLGTTTLPISGLVVQDNLAELDIDSTWSAEYKGQGVVVAILDSGVDVEHEDLAGRYRGGTNSWFDAYQQRDAPIDLSGHGTAVGSIILGGDATGSYIGVAPNARWIAARIFDDDGVSTESAISETLQWVLDPDQNPDTDDYPDAKLMGSD